MQYSEEYKRLCTPLAKAKYRRIGELGVIVSHSIIWKTIIDNQIEYTCIFEDDAIICPNFEERLEFVLSKVTQEMMVVFIGGRFTRDFQTPYSIPCDVGLCYYDNTMRFNGSHHDRTAHAYIITLQGAKYLYDRLCTAWNGLELDKFMIQELLPHRVYNSNPHLCYSPIYDDSDIRDTSRV
jgi:GR25 family glycosyltransferase involved in LPS biosynthesis